MSATSKEDFLASIAELEAQLADAPAEMRPMVEQQIANMRGMLPMFAKIDEGRARYAAHRPELSGAVKAFFTPGPPCEIPSWISDSLTRAEASEDMLRCPEGARVYVFEDSLGCAVPQGPGAIPMRHGLQLNFYKSTGGLESQSFYENGCLRWSIHYHATGGRSSVGHYVGNEPKVYLEQGVHTAFAPNGCITSQSAWWQGTRHGWTKLWEEDGYPIGATFYENGKASGEMGADGSQRRLD